MPVDSWHDPLARAFRAWGYLQADIDPLERREGFVHGDIADLTADADADAIDHWRSLYCGSIGAEFLHLREQDRAQWVASRMEEAAPEPDRDAVFRRLAEAELFERFLHARYVGSKRYSLEGIAALIPLLDGLLSAGADHGAELAFLAMSHRGRLTVMDNVVGVPAADILAGIEDPNPRDALGAGDVRYHHGATGTWSDPFSDRTLDVHLVSNPSHLEFVDPVAMGRVRARQARLGEDGVRRVFPITIHGDGAFAGQGVTAETLNLMELEGFSVGGTIRVIANNRIGFTTRPGDLHSSRFSSDLAHRLSIPIFHVNAEDPDAVLRVARMAADYRDEFGSDVVIDLVGFRRYGHSEVDDPTVAEPILYEQIGERPLLYERYAEQIGMAKEDREEFGQSITDALAEAHDDAREASKTPAMRQLPGYWDGYSGGLEPPASDADVETGVDADRLERLGAALRATPEGFQVHPKVEKLLDAREAMTKGEKPVDWATAELLAFASLLDEEMAVRFSGQDSRRGTFNQRHAILRDVETDAAHIPLEHLGTGRFGIFDSPLSEAAIVGFEYGYSRDMPDGLICWEAQFGDFVNGAQVPIDQFLVAGEDKWGLLSGLVLLLPHGYEGQGPEHSSARMERFLNLCAEHNMIVAQPTTAAQHFHLLRWQAKRKWRKPLIVFTPKGMLRAPATASERSELTEGRFQTILEDAAEGAVRKVLLCTGRVGHDLSKARDKAGLEGITILRLDQLYPFPYDELKTRIRALPSETQLIWVQEEPSNMGAWNFVRPRLRRICGDRHVASVTRSESASPASGSAGAHRIEQQTLMDLALR